jgi:viroplasmin and RNaseH domain-containing protein
MKNQHYITGYLKGNEIGVIDLDGKFNNSESLDFDSRMFFDSVEEAKKFLGKLKDEKNHPDFNYQIEEVENYD